MKKLLLSTALVAVLATPGLAQTQSDTVQTPTTQATMALMSLSGLEISADKLIGHRVHTPEMGGGAAVDMHQGIADAPDTWEDVGEIGDVLIDSLGKVNSVVVDAGGFLGVGERSVRVALADLQIINDADNDDEFFVVYTGSRAMLEEAKPYDAASADHGDVTPMERDANALGDANSAAAADPTTPMPRPDREGLMIIKVDTLTADDLQGARVYGQADGWIGEIGELILTEDGKMSKVVVDVGGWLGMGEHPVALGFDQVELRREGNDGDVFAYVDYTQDELEAMPEWSD
jgi:hypothetical protein